MAENKMYSGHDTSGFVPRTEQQRTSPETDTTENYEYLKLVSSLLDRFKQLESFVYIEDERRKSYEEQRKKALDILKATVDKAAEVKENIWKAGSNTDEMLQEIVKLQEEGIGLKKDARETLESAGDIVRDKMDEYLSGEFVETLHEHLGVLDGEIKKFETAHQEALEALKKEYVNDINILKATHEKRLKQAVEEKNRILLPSQVFWTIACIIGLIVLWGLWGWYRFWNTPGNDIAMNYMIVTIIAEGLYGVVLASTYFSNKKDKGSNGSEKSEPDKNELKIYSVSLSEAIYIMLLTLSSTVYIVWMLMDVSGNSWVLQCLLPASLAANFIWLFMRGIAYGVFQKEF